MVIFFSGAIPLTNKVDGTDKTQVFSEGNGGIAYLDTDGYVTVHPKDINNAGITFDMVESGIDPYVVEFTQKLSGGNFLVRNKDGIVVEIRIDYPNSFTSFGIVAKNVIKVASGQMLQHDGVSYALVGDGDVIPTTSGGDIDIIPNGSTGRKINVNDDTTSHIKRQIDNIKITKDNKLLVNDVEIGEDFTSIGKFSQTYVLGLAIGSGKADAITKRFGNIVYGGAGVEQSWLDEYNTFITVAEKPKCDWVISMGANQNTTRTTAYCSGSTPTVGINKEDTILAINTIGEVYAVVGDALVLQEVNNLDDAGFRSLYNTNDNFALFSNSSDTKIFKDFEEQETNVVGSLIIRQ